MRETALTIAGSDPTGGAGLQMDLRVFHHFGVYGLSAVAALTAQNTFKVGAVTGVAGRFLEEQLDTLLNDIRPGALKTGMLYSSGAVRAVVKAVKGFALRNLVIDPVAVSSTGTPLMEEGALEVLREELLPLARVITPNVPEACALSGIPAGSEEDIEKVAVRLKELGPDVVIITGGHSGRKVSPAPAAGTIELVYDGHAFLRIPGKRTPGEFHGTGCAFSAAVTALLAKGVPVADAAVAAKDFVQEAIGRASPFGRGMRLLPVEHLTEMKGKCPR
ncbi:MAG: bifunctional hydroxymethylpyrimidine kinase/phosphomethylpyrimidine kinase [Thermodesulfovibrionales bacterium]